MAAEASPNSARKITLEPDEPEVDNLGLKQTLLNRQLLPLDKSTFRKTTIHFAKLLIKQKQNFKDWDNIWL